MKGMFGRNGKKPTEKYQHPDKFDARPPEVRTAAGTTDVFMTSIPPEEHMDILVEVNRKLDILLAERETTNKGIAAIKQIVAGLTYGEMVELRDQLEKHVPNIGNSEATAAIVKSLPETFHAWATS